MSEPHATMWTDAPEVAIPEPPALFGDGVDLCLAYGTTAGPAGDACAVVVFRHVIDHRLSPINDEGLGYHPYAAGGLQYYAFNEVLDSAETIRWSALGARHWVVTFKDNTLDVLAQSAQVVASAVNHGDAADALLLVLPSQRRPQTQE
jgi:hypothetical protein